MTTTDRTGADTATFEAELQRLDRLEVADEDTEARLAFLLQARLAAIGLVIRDVEVHNLARAAIAALKPAPGTDSSGPADEELTETVLAVFADWDARDARQREEDSGQAVQRPSATRRYVVGTYCPRGNGHFDLIASERYDGSCGSKGWPLIIEVEDGDDTSQLPKGYFEVDD